jgi:Tol biopolymer transport system component
MTPNRTKPGPCSSTLRRVCCLVVALVCLLSCQANTPTGKQTPAPVTRTQQPASALPATSMTLLPATLTPTLSATPSPSPPVSATASPSRTATKAPPPATATPAPTPLVADLLPNLAEKAIYYTDGSDFPSEIWKLDLKTRDKTLLFRSDEAGFEIDGLDLSPDKQFLAYPFAVFPATDSNRSGLQIMRTDGRELKTLAETEVMDDVFGAAVWSPDGSQLAYSRLFQPPESYPGTTRLHLFDLSTGQDKILADDLDPFAWSPVSRKILCGRPRYDVGWSGLYLVDPRSGEQEPVWEDSNLSFGLPAWQPGGKQIAVTATKAQTLSSTKPEATLYVLDLTTHARRELAKVDALDAQWSPDGEKLAYSSPLTYQQPTQATHLWLLDLRRGSAVQLLDTSTWPGFPTWSADGRALLVTVGEPTEPSWTSVLAVADRSLVKLVQVRARFVSVTW